MMIYKDTECVIDADNGIVSGHAYYEYEIERGLNADIGGIDGVEVTSCNLLGVDIGGGHILWPDDVSRILSKAQLVAMEDAAFDHVSCAIDCGMDIDDILPDCFVIRGE